MFKNNKKIEKKEKKEVVKYDKYEKAEMRLIFYMVRNEEVIRIYEKNKVYFPTQEYRYLVNELIHYYDKHGKINEADFIISLTDKEEFIFAFVGLSKIIINISGRL